MIQHSWPLDYYVFLRAISGHLATTATGWAVADGLNLCLLLLEYSLKFTGRGLKMELLSFINWP